MSPENNISQVFDNHGRPISYVRLSVTDRCNLRCFYCMPATGMTFLPRKELLSYEEMERLIKILAMMGVSKVRITGGEPFVRRDLIDFLRRAKAIEGIEEIHITTNGVLTKKYLPILKDIGIASINLSLDTLDKAKFKELTRRDEFDKVWDTFNAILEHDIPLKLNAVVIDGKNTDDIIPMVELAKNYPVGVRFIEEMPFNGGDAHFQKIKWNHHKILETIQTKYPNISPVKSAANSTSSNYLIEGYKGTFGIIAAYSRTFCGTCNRIRITSQGTLQTCLYGNSMLSMRDLLRSNKDDEVIKQALLKTFSNRAKDGFEAEKNRKRDSPKAESMSVIGG